jgi:hypothetical protein
VDVGTGVIAVHEQLGSRHPDAARVVALHEARVDEFAEVLLGIYLVRVRAGGVQTEDLGEAVGGQRSRRVASCGERRERDEQDLGVNAEVVDALLVQSVGVDPDELACAIIGHARDRSSVLSA